MVATRMCFICIPIPREMIQFDLRTFFKLWVGSTTNKRLSLGKAKQNGGFVSTLSRLESSSPCFNQRPTSWRPWRGLEGSTVTIETAKPQTSRVTWPSSGGRIANGEDKEDEFAGSLPDEQPYGLPPSWCTWPECFEACPTAHHHG